MFLIKYIQTLDGIFVFVKRPFDCAQGDIADRIVILNEVKNLKKDIVFLKF